MFKFNFSNSSDLDDIGSSVLERDKEETSETDLNWQPAFELFSTETEKKLLSEGKWRSKRVTVLNDQYSLDLSIYYLSSESSNFGDVYNDTADIKEGQYEGGLKVWDCTYDLMKFLCNNLEKRFSGKKVLDLGCGNGFLGILSLYLGAESVHFQDYNDFVLKKVTIPNVLKNLEESNELSKNCKFYAGDWSSFSQLNDYKYDVVLTAATIYNRKNYIKLLTVFKEKLEQTGTVILAAKSYYFGWGGGTRQFESFLQDDSTFQSRILWTCMEGVQQEIMEITFKTNSESLVSDSKKKG